MIHISLTTALVIYSAVLGSMILFIWLYTEFSVRRSYPILEKQFLWRCVFCGYIYLDEAAESLSRCPRCENYNSIEDKHARYVQTRLGNLGPEEDASGIAIQRNSSRRKHPHQRRRGPRKRR